MGEAGFLEKLQTRLGALLAGKQRDSHSGGARRAHGEAEARALLVRGLAALGLGAKAWRELPRNAPEKTALAWWLRARTTVTLRWVSEELGLGHYTRVTQAVRKQNGIFPGSFHGLGKDLREFRELTRIIGGSAPGTEALSTAH